MRRLYMAFVLVGAFAIIEFIGAYLSHSLALGADGAHMLTDVGGVGFAVSVAYVARRRQTQNARQQIESRGAALSMSVLALVALGIVGYAIWRIFNPVEIESLLMLGVASLGLVLNVVILLLLQKDKKGSLNIKAAHFHVASDTLTSLGVVGAALLILGTGNTLFDPIVSIAIGTIIFLGAVHLRQESRRKLRELKEEAPLTGPSL